MISILTYNDFFKKIIKLIKYDLVAELCKDLSLIISPDHLLKIGIYKKLNHDFSLQPIPLHTAKVRVRGFNQAKLIAEFFQKYLGFTIDDVLIRVKETKPQSYLKKGKEKFVNMKDAFAIKANVTGKNLILVDDLLTSGATVKEATRILKKKGAKKVFVLTLAKG